MADALTTIVNVKAWLNITTTTDDLLLGRLITGASLAILGYLSRPSILSRSVSEVYNGHGGRRLILRQWPVTAIAALSVDGRAIAASTSPPLGAGYLIGFYDGVGPGAHAELDLVGFAFNRGLRNVSVTYTAGYSAVPADIDQACCEMIGERYRYRPRIGEVSKALPGGGSVAFSQKDLTDSVKLWLGSYRDVVPV